MFRVGSLTVVFCTGGLRLTDMGECEPESRLAAAALSWPGRSEVRPDLIVVGNTETAPRSNLPLSGGTLSTKAAGADIEDQVERAWSDPYPDSDLKLSDLSDLVSDRGPAMICSFQTTVFRQIGSASRVPKEGASCGAPRTAARHFRWACQHQGSGPPS